MLELELDEKAGEEDARDTPHDHRMITLASHPTPRASSPTTTTTTAGAAPPDMAGDHPVRATRWLPLVAAMACVIWTHSLSVRRRPATPHYDVDDVDWVFNDGHAPPPLPMLSVNCPCSVGGGADDVHGSHTAHSSTLATRLWPRVRHLRTTLPMDSEDSVKDDGNSGSDSGSSNGGDSGGDSGSDSGGGGGGGGSSGGSTHSDSALWLQCPFTLRLFVGNTQHTTASQERAGEGRQGETSGTGGEGGKGSASTEGSTSEGVKAMKEALNRACRRVQALRSALPFVRSSTGAIGATGATGATDESGGTSSNA